jgi:cell division protein FtsL
MTDPIPCDSPNCPFDGDPHDRRGWHLNKGLDLGHLVVTLSMLAGFVAWAMVQERRLTTVENGLVREHEVNLQQDAARSRMEDQAAAKLQRIEEKLDRIIESRGMSPGRN